MSLYISNKNNMGLLYTKIKIFHFKEKIDSLIDQHLIRPPIHIRIKPTNACNHNCCYCAYRVGNLQLGRDMVKRDYIPKEKMFEIIDDLQKMGVKAVTFSGGGEPFCYPYFLETLKKLVKTDIKFATLSNGALLNGEIAELLAHKATWVRISMDGWDNASYASYRKVPREEFTRVMKNIEQFKKKGGTCYLGITLIVDKKNAAYVYDFIKRIKNTGVNSVKVSPCIVSNSGSKNNAYHNTIFNLVKDQVSRAISDFVDGQFEIYDAYHELDKKFAKDYTWCPYLQILPVIGADLNIYPCQDKAYNLVEGLIGSIRHQRFNDFWFSDKNIFFKINPSRHCNHHCVANDKNRLILDYLNVDKDHLEFV